MKLDVRRRVVYETQDSLPSVERVYRSILETNSDFLQHLITSGLHIPVSATLDSCFSPFLFSLENAKDCLTSFRKCKQVLSGQPFWVAVSGFA